MREYLIAFDRLRKARSIGAEVINPIALCEMLAYLEMFGTNGSIDDFVDFIQVIDEVYINRFIKRRTDEINKSKAKAKLAASSPSPVRSRR